MWYFFALRFVTSQLYTHRYNLAQKCSHTHTHSYWISKTQNFYNTSTMCHKQIVLKVLYFVLAVVVLVVVGCIVYFLMLQVMKLTADVFISYSFMFLFGPSLCEGCHLRLEIIIYCYSHCKSWNIYFKKYYWQLYVVYKYLYKFSYLTTPQFYRQSLMEKKNVYVRETDYIFAKPFNYKDDQTTF